MVFSFGGNLQQISELTYLLNSGSDRIGALDFQQSATEYIPRLTSQASLDALLEAAERVQKGLPLTPALDYARYAPACYLIDNKGIFLLTIVKNGKLWGFSPEIAANGERNDPSTISKFAISMPTTSE